MTPGEPLFCNFCGRSYDVKLCPSRHPNSRIAEICSQCGSHDLSTPQPKVSLWWRALAWLTRVLFGMLVGCLSILLLLILLLRPEAQSALLGLGILVLVLWWLWSQLPNWFRKLVKRTLERRKWSGER
jgi:hypothetical protein